MERTKTLFKRATAILSGDWHLREDTPVCRIDVSFEEAQWRKVAFISDLQKQHDCPVLHSGDLFNHWKPSPYLLAQAMEYLPDQFYTIYGNHDLPQHNLELANKCGINVLAKAGKLTVLPGAHWGTFPGKVTDEPADLILNVGNAEGKRNILIWHVMTYQGQKPWPDCTDPISAALLRKYKDYDLILTGHNHKPFIEEYEGRLLVNPGSIMRQNADQLSYRPAVWLWYADTYRVVPVYLPIDNDVISREHLDEKKERENRLDSFIDKLNDDFEAALSFEENLELFSKQNDIRKSVMNIIYKSIEV